MQEDSVFGAEPDDLRRLVRFGLEPDDTDIDEETSSPTASVDELMEGPGARIGRYKLLRILGEGGMGVVYLAQQDKPVTREVALKVIKPGMDSKRVMARFEAEEQALALMEHPHVARVYDASLTGSGRPYFVMEYVKGIPITEHCDKYKLTIDERLHLFLHVCEAVQHAHQKGIIHRDLKPSNILVSIEGNKSVPKVIDFGVARAVSQQLTEKTLHTEQGQLIGTPEYMSPEQADLNNQDIDTRTDIYALGVVLYKLLAGFPPFDPQTLQAAGIEHIRKIICEKEPKTPSTCLSKTSIEESMESAQRRSTNIRALQRRLQGDLDWITLKAMAKDRTRRYESVGELTADIQRHLNHEAVLAGPPSTLYRIGKFTSRNRALVTGVGVVLGVLVVGVIVSTLFAIGQARARAEADAVSAFLQKNVLRSLNLWDIKGEEITARSILDAASQGLSGELATEPLVEASIRWTLANSYTWLGLYELAESHAKRALEIRQAQLDPQDIATLSSFFQLGWLYFYQSRYNKAERLLTQALEGMELTLNEQHESRLYCMATLGCVYTMQGRLPEAEQLFNRGLGTIRRVWGEESEHSPTFLQGLAWVYYMQGRYEKAELLFKQAFTISRHLLGERHWETLTVKHNLGYLYCDLGRYNEAEQFLVEALGGRRRVLGEQHSHTLMTMCALGRLYYAQGRFEKAESLLDQAMENSLQILDGAHFITAECKYERGTLYLSQGQHDEAELLLDEALEIGRRALGEENWATLKIMNTLAKLYTAQGRYKEAEKTFRQTLEARKNKLGEDHPHTLETKNDLAVLYKKQGNYEKAEPLLLEAIEGRRLKLGDTHPHAQESIKNLIDLYQAWNKPEKAEEWRAKLPKGESSRDK